jgi:outer membrane protein TolC
MTMGNILIILALFFSCGICRELTLLQTIEFAMQNSRELKLAQSELEMANARITEAWAGALPVIDADFNYNRNLKDAKFFFSAEDSAGNATVQSFDFSFKNNFSATAELRQTLYNGKVGTALQIAYLYEDYAAKNFMYQKQSILINTKLSFYAALLAKNIYELSLDSEESARENYNETKFRYESGVLSEYELLQAEVRWRNVVPQTISAKKNYELALNTLKSEIDIPISEEIILNGSLDRLPVVPNNIDALDVFESRTDYQALILEGKMRDRNISLEFAEHFPTLSGSFTYSYQGQSDEFKLENDYDNYVLGLSLKIPIFSGGYTSAQVQKAQIEYDQALTRIAQAKDQIEMNLNNVILELKESQERMAAAEKSVLAAQRAFDIAESRAENGMATQLELKDSRIFLDQAKINNLTARFDFLKAYYQWQLTTGLWQEDI